VTRETFASRIGAVMTMVGVAVGLGNVWRFPYLVGRYGGAAFVLMYVAIVVLIGVPALMAEWALGRTTRRGTVGAYALGGFPGGRFVGWALFAIVAAATAYYTNVVGWVGWFAVAQLASRLGVGLEGPAILPPEMGLQPRSLVLQLIATLGVTVLAGVVLARGLRRGIERTSVIVLPVLCAILGVLIVRSLTLPGAEEGVAWYVLKVRAEDITPQVMLSALGHAMFSLSLGGTFMVTYGSYLPADDGLVRSAVATTAGDTISGLLAGFAIFPAVFAFGLAPASGPGLIFATLPEVFARIPAGWLFAFLFFAALFGAGFLSAIGAFEVLVAGLVDNLSMSRPRAVVVAATIVMILAVPPMINMRIFVPWDLTFGSGMQTLGAFLAVVTVGWCFTRSRALAALAAEGRTAPPWLYFWIRYVIPGAILAVGVWWALAELLGVVANV
jgi:neurotransmitter:Na+ symporter, NSS family